MKYAITFFCLLLASCATGPKVGSFNLSQVTPGLWRSGQMQTESEFVTLTNKGVRVIVKLNLERLDWESVMCRKYGIALVTVPISLDEQLGTVPGWKLAAIQDAVRADGTLVHCENGWDRTGLAVFLYRITHGWTFDQAYAELITLGFHPILKGLDDVVESYRHAQPQATHATWYIDPLAPGSQNGTSPANAWHSPSQMQGVKPGDVVVTNNAKLLMLVPQSRASAVVGGGYYDTNGCWHYVANGKQLVYCRVLHTNDVTFQYPRDAASYRWSLLISADLIHWTMVASNMIYNPSVTTWLDVKATNNNQYWRMIGLKV